MQDPEIDRINKKLLDNYGKFSHTDMPNYRMVWSTEQFEMRWTWYTREGFELPYKEVRKLPKYRQSNPDLWVLERCLDVPPFVETDLVDDFSYEPIWFFKTDDGKFQMPVWRAVEFIVESIIAASARALGRKYKDPNLIDPKDQPEAERARVAQLKEDLFGNESDLTDALHGREGIVVP
jgi:hypothetical protein